MAMLVDVGLPVTVSRAIIGTMAILLEVEVLVTWAKAIPIKLGIPIGTTAMASTTEVPCEAITVNAPH